MFKQLSDYIALTKPRIVMLFAMTGFAAMAMEGNAWRSPLWSAIVLVGIICTAASANALNQYVERDLDALMRRTREKRPLPSGRLQPRAALIFSLLLGGFACALLWWYANLLSAVFALGTILFYVGIYTMWLKPRTPYNIVIGGAAGATAPLIAWAAATGTIGWAPFVLFLIIFIWTPPHFWALALCYADDYQAAGFPMLPVVAGEERTRTEIFWYSLLLAPLPLLLAWSPRIGPLYVIGAAILGAGFIWRAYLARYRPGKSTAGALFGYSIVYLFVLCILLTVDAAV